MEILQSYVCYCDMPVQRHIKKYETFTSGIQTRGFLACALQKCFLQLVCIVITKGIFLLISIGCLLNGSKQ